MKIDREALLGSLKLLRPALADKSPVEALKYIWLSGDSAMAYNDIIAIGVSCLDTGIHGGVMGTTLLGLLEASTAKEVELTADNSSGGSALLLQSAGVKAKLPLVPPENAVFTFPDVPGKGFAVDDGVAGAFAYAMVALASAGDNMGVALVPEGDSLAVYATDGTTIAWSRIGKPKGYKARRLVLSPLFCSQLAALDEGGMTLGLTDDFALAEDSQSGTWLFGRLVEVAKELDFAGVIAANLPEGENGTPIPDKLSMSLDRAEVLVNGVQRPSIQISVKQGVLRLSLHSDLGDLNEALKLAGAHPDAAGSFNGAFIRRALPHVDHFLMSDVCFAMLGAGDSGFLVAAAAKK